MAKGHGDGNKNLGEVYGFAGEVRRSKLVSTAGPGAIVDLAVRPTGEPVSGVVACIEEWDDVEQIRERRLEQRHGLDWLGMPPVRQREDRRNQHTVPLVRFPGWLQCPECKTLRPADRWARNAKNIHHAGRYCNDCKNDRGHPVAVVPVRFITACEHGHLDDFPWKGWIGCTCDHRTVKLKMVQRGAGLAGLHLWCTNSACPGHTGETMETIFKPFGLKSKGLDACKGNRPWLSATANEECDQQRRVLQRGASNVYWPDIDSALDIPPLEWERIPELDRFLDTWQTVPAEARIQLIGNLGLEKATGMSVSEITSYYERAAGEFDSDEPLTFEEYRHFMSARERDIEHPEFELTRVALEGPDTQSPDDGFIRPFVPLIDLLVQAHRLREVRLMHSFTRIYPPRGAFSDDNVQRSPISRGTSKWLPAVELRGEGLFVSLELEKVRAWEQLKCVLDRVDALRESIRGDLFDREEFPSHVDARFILLHSLAHALMTRLTLSCGYSSASLVERIYSHTPGPDSPGPDMAGILIHTGTPDADGTLGGLVEQGEASRFCELLLESLTDMSWCSSDPLCITGTATLSNPRNGAACHSCLLVPETSCTMFNRYLDRALLIGAPGSPGLGFFEHLLGQGRGAQ